MDWVIISIIIILKMQPQQSIDQTTIVMCFQYIHDPSSNPDQRKQANTLIIESEKYLVPLIKILVQIFQNQTANYNVAIRLQALIYLSNVVKRNWNNKALLKKQPQFPQIKKHLPAEMMKFLQSGQKIFTNTLFDIIKFIAKSDYPHNFPDLTSYVLNVLSNIQTTEQHVKYMKQIRDIFLQLAQKKGFVNPKSYEEGPRKILNALCPISQALREQLCKIQQLSNIIAKFSKYCDQIIICLLRIAPYSYLDDQNFMIIIGHISQKLQSQLTSHSNQSNKNKMLLEKDIKSIVYQLGCLQIVNPCILAPVLSDYIGMLFYIISKPELFVKPATVKYSLLSMKKLIKQFAYFADDSIFVKSISSQPKSTNYLQLRNMAHAAYNEFMTEDTIQGLLNFLLTTIMSIKSKQDQSFSISFDQSGGGFEKSMEKDLTVHICGTLLAESLIERFNQKMLELVYSLTNNCIQNNWTNIDDSTIANFLSIIAVLPKSCKRNQMSQLQKFPIITVLQYAHGSPSLRTRQKFPVLICGWLDIFTNQQIGQLVQVLVNYVTEGAQSNNMEIALYSCYSLNKILNLRGSTIDSGYILHNIFPVAIKIFGQTDNPEILWPLINLISTLLTKCEFDTNIIINSIQSESLNSLISNQSEMLVEALCEMFKNFLCIIPRNKPATGVYKLIYHFLNIHLAKSQAQYHEKCIILWYYSIRQFSFINQCSQEYKNLFQHHFKRCSLIKKPIMVYILQQYLLSGLIQEKFDYILQLIINFYMEGGYVQFKDQISADHPQYRPKMAQLQDAYNLKIAALSFYITLLTKFSFDRANCTFILEHVLKDLTAARDDQNLPTNLKSTLNTLRNSYISVINRYIILNPDYFFSSLQNQQIPIEFFYSHYLSSSIYLTSRGATRINALALTSILPKTGEHLKSVNKDMYWQCVCKILQLIIVEVQNSVKLLTGQEGPNAGKIQNSPVYRFSQTILSERKELVRKQGAYDSVEIHKYFLQQFKQFLNNTGSNLDEVCQIIQQVDPGKNLGSRLVYICK